MNKKVEKLRAIETTSQQVSSLIVNLSAIDNYKEVDLKCMESFKSIMHLGTDQLKKFIELLEESGKDLDEYSIYYYTKQLKTGPLKLFVSKFTVNEDGSLKTYWKLSPDTIGLLGNTNRSQVNIPIASFTEELTNIDSLTVAKMPIFMIGNAKEATLLTNSMFALAYVPTLAFDTNGSQRLQQEVLGNYNKTPHGSYVVSDVETHDQFKQLNTPIQTKVKDFLEEEDYRMYTAKRNYNLFLSVNKTTNIKVERKLEYTQTNLDTGEEELKSVIIETNLIGNTFDSNKAREGSITVNYPDKNVNLKLHTVEGQLGSTNKITSAPISK